MATRRSVFLIAAGGAVVCAAAALMFVRWGNEPIGTEARPRVVDTAGTRADAVRDDAERSDTARGDRVRGDAVRGDAVRGDAVRGLALLSAFRDSLPDHSGNALRCTSCHLDSGTRATAMSWKGAATKYPRYRARPGYVEDMARRINECIARSLAGRMLYEDSRDMRDMIAYMESLRHQPRPAAVDSVRLTGVVARGRAAYATTCARCHGAAGEGTAQAPPAWGEGSFAIGAGLARQFTMATFLRHNMPFDHATTLSHQQAADIAAFVLTQPRQDHPGKERDWPNADPPSDVAYVTSAARAAGKPLPAPRPLLPRRVSPDSLTPR